MIWFLSLEKDTFQLSVAKEKAWKFLKSNFVLDTTRPKEEGEINGIDYHFVSKVKLFRTGLEMFLSNTEKSSILSNQFYRIQFSKSIKM